MRRSLKTPTGRLFVTITSAPVLKPRWCHSRTGWWAPNHTLTYHRLLIRVVILGTMLTGGVDVKTWVLSHPKKKKLIFCWLMSFIHDSPQIWQSGSDFAACSRGQHGGIKTGEYWQVRNMEQFRLNGTSENTNIFHCRMCLLGLLKWTWYCRGQLQQVIILNIVLHILYFSVCIFASFRSVTNKNRCIYICLAKKKSVWFSYFLGIE